MNFDITISQVINPEFMYNFFDYVFAVLFLSVSIKNLWDSFTKK